MSIEVRDVGFSYSRGSTALTNVRFTIQTGVSGLVGSNGAGKTTLLGILAGLMRPQTGSVIVDGEPAEAARLMGRIALIPETPRFEPWLTVEQFLEGLADTRELKDYALPPRVAEIARRRLTELSLGQKRQVEFAAALLGSPRVILLDEPTNGLDPVAVAELRQTLLDLKNRGVYLIVSSHHLDELQRIADTVLLLTRGSLGGMWAKAELMREYGSLDNFFSAQAQLGRTNA